MADVATREPGELDPRLVKAIAHPLRHRILLALNERVASPKEIAEQLGQPIGRVSHHVRVLLGLDAIELTDTRQRRGATEHFYRATLRPWFGDDDWAELPRSTRRSIFGELLERIGGDVGAAAAGTGFDHPEAHVSFTPLELDAEGMTAVAKLLSETLKQALAIESESRARGAAGEPLRTELAIMLFEPAQR